MGDLDGIIIATLAMVPTTLMGITVLLEDAIAARELDAMAELLANPNPEGLDMMKRIIYNPIRKSEYKGCFSARAKRRYDAAYDAAFSNNTFQCVADKERNYSCNSPDKEHL